MIARWALDFNITIGYSWQSNAVETDNLKKSNIAFGKIGLLADVHFAIGINRPPEIKKRNLMAVTILTSRDSDDTGKVFMGWSFTPKGYPVISNVSQEFELDDTLDIEMV